ncbi:hypothetical protein B0H65DRAFT_94957 [Neurospora tetraspora]|uniref:Uncharacterized protein n=1 Tax=Neurospora tetraspora TaxID=94610 RepID=A0AAE0MUE6_9PEZI|nr:hypothetical protein B0H65DRAFT_94957 [Neurospora tetraspora]
MHSLDPLVCFPRHTFNSRIGSLGMFVSQGSHHGTGPQLDKTTTGDIARNVRNSGEKASKHLIVGSTSGLWNGIIKALEDGIVRNGFLLQKSTARNKLPRGRDSLQLHCRAPKKVLPILQRATSCPEPHQEIIENGRSRPLLDRRKKCPDSSTAFLNYGEISTRLSSSDVSEVVDRYRHPRPGPPDDNTPNCTSDDDDDDDDDTEA